MTSREANNAAPVTDVGLPGDKDGFPVNRQIPRTISYPNVVDSVDIGFPDTNTVVIDLTTRTSVVSPIELSIASESDEVNFIGRNVTVIVIPNPATNYVVNLVARSGADVLYEEGAAVPTDDITLFSGVIDNVTTIVNVECVKGMFIVSI